MCLQLFCCGFFVLYFWVKCSYKRIEIFSYLLSFAFSISVDKDETGVSNVNREKCIELYCEVRTVSLVNEQYCVFEHNGLLFKECFPNPIPLKVLFCMDLCMTNVFILNPKP